MKRVLVVLALPAAAVMIPSMVIAAVTFGGIRALVDGTELAGGARLQKHGCVAVAVLPAGEGADALTPYPPGR